LIAEKDKGVSEKEDRPTKRIFKDLIHSQHIRVEKSYERRVERSVCLCAQVLKVSSVA
jgi:hypothetical protein